MVTPTGGRKQTYIVMVGIRNLRIECGCCAVKQRSENVLSKVAKDTNSL